MRRSSSLFVSALVGLSGCGTDAITTSDFSGGKIAPGLYIGSVECNSYGGHDSGSNDGVFYGFSQRLIGENGVPIIEDLGTEIREGSVAVIYTPFGAYQGTVHELDYRSVFGGAGYYLSMDVGSIDGVTAGERADLAENAARIDGNNIDFIVEGDTDRGRLFCKGVLSK
ncbi:MAG: hypothetical protein ABIG28_00530 [archaeon]